jgi:hypothetical protein
MKNPNTTKSQTNSKSQIPILDLEIGIYLVVFGFCLNNLFPYISTVSLLKK